VVFSDRTMCRYQVPGTFILLFHNNCNRQSQEAPDKTYANSAVPHLMQYPLILYRSCSTKFFSPLAAIPHHSSPRAPQLQPHPRFYLLRKKTYYLQSRISATCTANYWLIPVRYYPRTHLAFAGLSQLQ
jgi:hypothetical protein